MIARSRNLVLIGWFVLAGCGEERLGGNSMETENSLARELSVDSLADGRWPTFSGSMVIPVRLSAANFNFKYANSKGSGIGFEQLDGRPLPYEIPVWDSAARIGRTRVRIEGNLLLGNAKIRMRWGLDSASPIPDTAATWAGIPRFIRDDWTSVLVDDFEDGNDSSALPVRGKWRLASYGTQGVSGPFLTAAGLGRAGTAMRFKYSSPSTDYTVFAASLSNRPIVLRGLDSLVFWARGGGRLYVAFEHLTSGFGPKSWMNMQLPTTWTRIRISPNDLDPAGPPGNSSTNVGWNAVRDSVTDLSFIVQGGSEFWIDDIRLHGIDEGDLR